MLMEILFLARQHSSSIYLCVGVMQKAEMECSRAAQCTICYLVSQYWSGSLCYVNEQLHKQYIFF